jgi:hypothetical protein
MPILLDHSQNIITQGFAQIVQGIEDQRPAIFCDIITFLDQVARHGKNSPETWRYSTEPLADAIRQMMSRSDIIKVIVARIEEEADAEAAWLVARIFVTWLIEGL